MENVMPVIRFDKHRFIKTVAASNEVVEESKKIDSKTIEALAEAFDEALEQSQGSLLTKTEFKQELTQFKSDIRQEMFQVKSDIRQEMSQLEVRLTNTINAAIFKIVGLTIAVGGFLAGLMKFLN